ncbi:MAG: hypothetical protein QOK28_1259 [Actinomycetota bacterium]|jgi:hypothetical protein
MIHVAAERISELLTDDRGRKGVLIGLAVLFLTVLFGLPPFLSWTRTVSRPGRIADTHWRRASQLTGPQDWASPNSIAFGDERWVMVGSIGTSDASPAAWYSTDGQAWKPASVEVDPAGDTTAAQIASVAYAHRTWIAVGSAIAFGHSDAAVWQSSDGANWRRVAAGSTALGGPGLQTMFDVVADSSGWLAVGAENFGGDANGAVWRSSDGTNWTRNSDAGDAFGGPGDQVMAAVTHAEPDLWIIGGRQDLDEHSDAVVWSSSDGVSWHRQDAREFQGSRDDAIYDVATADGKIVAVGATRLDQEVDAVIWTSRDGKVWTRVPFSREIFGGVLQQTAKALTHAPGRWIAAGENESSGAFNPVVWTSRDGSHWARVETDEFREARRSRMISVTSHKDTIIAVGTRDDGVGQLGASWRRRS